jgi:hypothetical protein
MKDMMNDWEIWFIVLGKAVCYHHITSLHDKIMLQVHETNAEDNP